MHTYKDDNDSIREEPANHPFQATHGQSCSEFRVIYLAHSRLIFADECSMTRQLKSCLSSMNVFHTILTEHQIEPSQIHIKILKIILRLPPDLTEADIIICIAKELNIPEDDEQLRTMTALFREKRLLTTAAEGNN